MNTMANTSKNILNADVEIRGSLKCTSELSFDGKVEGDLATEGALEIGENALIKGNISAANAVIRGKINGNASAKDKLELKSRTELVGDIRAAKLVIEEGVTFVGRAEINPSKTVPTAPAAHPLRPGEAYKASEPSRMGR
jgi:cytoskeletal protein CcmA (bactofilin family)